MSCLFSAPERTLMRSGSSSDLWTIPWYPCSLPQQLFTEWMGHLMTSSSWKFLWLKGWPLRVTIALKLSWGVYYCHIQTVFVLGKDWLFLRWGQHSFPPISLKNCVLYLPHSVLCLVALLCLTLCYPIDGSPPCSSVHGDSPGKYTGGAATPFSRGSSQPRGRTQVSRTAGRFFTSWTTREAGSFHLLFILKHFQSHACFPLSNLILGGLLSKN